MNILLPRSHNSRVTHVLALLIAFPLYSQVALTRAATPATQPTFLKQEFLFDQASFRSCHACTLCETRRGLVAAFFAGTREGNADVGIWVCREIGGHWSEPVQVVQGVSDSNQPLPCWNPVLFQPPTGPLLLFYKVGPSPKTWWGMLTTSDDFGKTWNAGHRLPDGILGPIKNKPVLLGDTLICPSSTEHHGWQVHLEFTKDLGKTWTATEPLNDGTTIAAIQPTILVHNPANLQVLCRTKQGKIHEAFSTDAGKTWSALAATDLPNPNSGIDAVELRNGRSLLVYNHTARGRSPLNIAISEDKGKTWKPGPVLESEAGEYSYPAVIQTTDGMVHVLYTWKREKIRHVVLDPGSLKPDAKR